MREVIFSYLRLSSIIFVSSFFFVIILGFGFIGKYEFIENTKERIGLLCLLFVGSVGLIILPMSLVYDFSLILIALILVPFFKFLMGDREFKA